MYQHTYSLYLLFLLLPHVLLILPHSALIALNMCLHTYESLYDCICVLILLCVLILYISLYYHMCVLILLYVCSHTTICPHTTIYMSSDNCICVLILLYMRPHTTLYVTSYYYISSGLILDQSITICKRVLIPLTHYLGVLILLNT